ncbi:Hint domain-containing protein [Ruegeria marina]|uniref:Hemolysin-type calcium-binding repeat-containing protein n=1 Tax=Ruegeria marina TaxID=639004 RepID=A0A1G7ARN7_9RHOB|nr:Hint domain-containing protein [Ruegeria marina]SDE17392.1 Hemolysin-type calcium-binding repeat-containing protein [Ruegeria marina]
MPSGYLVTLGVDQDLSLAASIGGALVNFTTAELIGSGEWAWSGTFGGTTYNNQLETGQYFQATDGNLYFVPDLGPVSTLSEAQAVSAPYFSPFNKVQGTSNDDLIDDTYADNNGNSVDSGQGSGPDGNGDQVFAGQGNDTVDAGLGDDLVYGGSGNDDIQGGDGDDLLYGDGQGSSTESLNWFAEGTDGTDLSGGFTQTTGSMNVSVSFTDDGNNRPVFEVDTAQETYVDSGDIQSEFSSLYLAGQGRGATSTTRIEFSARSDFDVAGEVENVMFRINDIDWASRNHRDILEINAYDANGNPVAVTLTPTGAGTNPDTVSGNTITAGDQSDSALDESGSVLVEIAGPVQSIEIIYSNALSGTQAVWISDVYFDTRTLPDGNDTIDGGLGNDTIDGQGGDDSLLGGEGDDELSGNDGSDTLSGGAGNDLLSGGEGPDLIFGDGGQDTISVSHGDTVHGGDNDDLFVLTDLGEAGGGSIEIVGGESDETGGDTLDLGGVVNLGTINLTTNLLGEKAGTVELLDGTLVTFSNIESIICFTPGTLIATAHGQRRIETLSPGELIVTRDNGLQPLRWIGSRTVAAQGRHAPVQLDPALLQGASAPLLVSPQHRMLWTGSRAQMYFGEPEVLIAASHLLENPAARRVEGGQVTYIHLMLDRHEIIYANDAATESFFPGDEALAALCDRARDEMFQLFPELRSHQGGFGDTARLCLKAHEARLLAA